MTAEKILLTLQKCLVVVAPASDLGWEVSKSTPKCVGLFLTSLLLSETNSNPVFNMFGGGGGGGGGSSFTFSAGSPGGDPFSQRGGMPGMGGMGGGGRRGQQYPGGFPF